MKKAIEFFAKGIGLGMGIGLCLAGAVGLVYQALHGTRPGSTVGRSIVYFFAVGGLMGLIGGWCLSLQMILGGLLSSLFLKVAQLVPVPAGRVTQEWAGKMEEFFTEVLKPMPSLFHRVVEGFLVVRFRNYGKINRALERTKRRDPSLATAPEWVTLAALHYFLEPLWLFFYGAYVILFLLSCVLWSLAFLT